MWLYSVDFNVCMYIYHLKIYWACPRAADISASHDLLMSINRSEQCLPIASSSPRMFSGNAESCNQPNTKFLTKTHLINTQIETYVFGSPQRLQHGQETPHIGIGRKKYHHIAQILAHLLAWEFLCETVIHEHKSSQRERQPNTQHTKIHHQLSPWAGMRTSAISCSDAHVLISTPEFLP